MKKMMLVFAVASLSGVAFSAHAAERCRDVHGRYIVCHHVAAKPVIVAPGPVPGTVEKCRDRHGHFMKCVVRPVR